MGYCFNYNNLFNLNQFFSWFYYFRLHNLDKSIKLAKEMNINITLYKQINLDHTDSPVLCPAKVIEFSDDASIVAQPDIAFRLAPFMKEIYGRDRLTLLYHLKHSRWGS